MNELRRRAGVAVRLALTSGSGEQLLGYLDEMDTEDLEELQEAGNRLGDAASEILGRRHL